MQGNRDIKIDLKIIICNKYRKRVNAQENYEIVSSLTILFVQIWSDYLKENFELFYCFKNKTSRPLFMKNNSCVTNITQNIENKSLLIMF